MANGYWCNDESAKSNMYMPKKNDLYFLHLNDKLKFRRLFRDYNHIYALFH